MPRFATVPTLNVNDAISDAYVDALTGNVNYLTVAGADVAALGANNAVAIAAEFQRVTVVTGNIDNITDVAGLVAGQPVRLLFTNAQTMRNNGGGAGNIRTVSGSDRAVVANEIVTLAYDSITAVWREGNAVAGLVKLWDSVDAGVALPAASITTPTLPGTFKHLLIEFAVQCSVSSQNLLWRVNGDTTGNYYYEYVQGIGATLTSVPASAQTSFFFGVIGGGEATVGSARILSYKDAAFPHNFLGQSFCQNDGSGNLKLFSLGGMWNSAAAITSLTFFPSSGNLVAGSRITVYGEA